MNQKYKVLVEGKDYKFISKEQEGYEKASDLMDELHMENLDEGIKDRKVTLCQIIDVIEVEGGDKNEKL